jgi:hypothetical protein
MTRNPQAVIPGGGPQQSSVPKGAAGSYPHRLAMPSARAGRPPARTALRRFGDSATIAIAVFCIVYFGLRELLAVLS